MHSNWQTSLVLVDDCESMRIADNYRYDDILIEATIVRFTLGHFAYRSRRGRGC